MTPFPTRSIVDAVMRNAGRSTLPFQQAHTRANCGTAFWYNDLVDAKPGAERVRQYLLTATAATRFDLGQWTFRPQLCDPAMSAQYLLMRDFAGEWTPLDGLGVSALPADGLHHHAARKGWRWTTDEVTEGIAATTVDLDEFAAEPRPAFVLGHDLGPAGERLQLVAASTVSRDRDNTLLWHGELSEGCAGAPVFTALHRGGAEWKLVCLGVALPGEGCATIAPFDRIRAAVRAIGN